MSDDFFDRLGAQFANIDLELPEVAVDREAEGTAPGQTYDIPTIFDMLGWETTHRDGDAFMAAMPREERDSDPPGAQQMWLYATLLQRTVAGEAPDEARRIIERMDDWPAIAAAMGFHYGAETARHGVLGQAAEAARALGAGRDEVLRLKGALWALQALCEQIAPKALRTAMERIVARGLDPEEGR
jgi:hypothetical protein